LIICFESNDLYFFYDFLKKIKEWEQKIFWIGVFSFFSYDDWIFFQKDQFMNFLNYFFFKKNNQMNIVFFSIFFFFHLIYFLWFMNSIQLWKIHFLFDHWMFNFYSFFY
jgi:hypothetical protein